MRLLLGLAAFVLVLVALNIWRIRRRSIAGIKQRNQYFRRLARELQFTVSGDDYLVQLEGNWRGRSALLYPHNFEGPGSITIVNVRTRVAFAERTWIEPSLGLGRAIVEWKRGAVFSFEHSGNLPGAEELLNRVEAYRKKFPFVALTLPTRFLFSQLATESLRDCKEFVVVVALDSGRRPATKQLAEALDAASDLADILEKTASSRI